jgi:hypothetical protein
MKRGSTSIKAKLVVSRKAKRIKVLERTKNKLNSFRTSSYFVLIESAIVHLEVWKVQ